MFYTTILIFHESSQWKQYHFGSDEHDSPEDESGEYFKNNLLGGLLGYNFETNELKLMRFGFEPRVITSPEAANLNLTPISVNPIDPIVLEVKATRIENSVSIHAKLVNKNKTDPIYLRESLNYQSFGMTLCDLDLCSNVRPIFPKDKIACEKFKIDRNPNNCVKLNPNEEYQIESFNLSDSFDLKEQKDYKVKMRFKDYFYYEKKWFNFVSNEVTIVFNTCNQEAKSENSMFINISKGIPKIYAKKTVANMNKND